LWLQKDQLKRRGPIRTSASGLRDYYDPLLRADARDGAKRGNETALDQLKVAHLSQITQARVRHETDSELRRQVRREKEKGQTGEKYKINQS